MESNYILSTIISLIPYILIFLSLVAYVILISAGKFEEKWSRIESSYLFVISGILFAINYAILLVYYLVFKIIPTTINETYYNTISITLLSSGINILLDILFVGASILLIIIGAKNTQYFHLIITGALYLFNVIISYVFSFIFNFLSQNRGIMDFNFLLLLNLIEIITIGTIILAAEISFLIFSVKYERDFNPIKNKFKTTGILLVIGAVLYLIYYPIYFGILLL